MQYNKWQFHVTRCGDRRGKVVYRCQFNTSHYFCDKDLLIEHENDKCQFRESGKILYDNSDPDVVKNR